MPIWGDTDTIKRSELSEIERLWCLARRGTGEEKVECFLASPEETWCLENVGKIRFASLAHVSYVRLKLRRRS